MAGCVVATVPPQADYGTFAFPSTPNLRFLSHLTVVQTC